MHAELKNSILDTMSNEQSKCTSFVQSVEDLYLLGGDFADLDDIPDPKDYLVGFYLVTPPPSSESPPPKSSPETRSKAVEPRVTISGSKRPKARGLRESVHLDVKKASRL